MIQSEIAGVGLPAAGFICNIVSGSVGVAEVPYHPAFSCPAGQYCLQGAKAGTPCSTGKYNPSVGGTSSANCLITPTGYYADTTGTFDLSTKVCPAGYYCLAGATSRTTNPCPAGIYRNLTESVQSSDCSTCPTGYSWGKNTVSPL